MSATSCFPLYHFQGDSRTRGLAYGDTLASRIRDTFSFYHERLFKRSILSVRDFEARAERVRTMVAAFDSELIAELDAVAIGADLPRWQIYLFNPR